MILHDFFIIFKHLDRMPAQICEVRIFFPEQVFNPLDPVLILPVIMDDHALRTFLIVMYDRMHQHIQSRPLSGGNRNDRNLP